MSDLALELETVSVETERITDLLELLYEHLDEEVLGVEDTQTMGTCFKGRVNLFLSLVSMAQNSLIEQVKKISTISDELYRRNGISV